MQLTEKHKKLLWIAVIVIAVIHFAPRVAFFANQATQQTPRKPSAGHPADPMPNMNSASLQAPGDGTTGQDFLRLRGNWMGQGLIANHGLCKAALQLKLNPEKGRLQGLLDNELRAHHACTPATPHSRESASADPCRLQ